jgi:hypothetical protein
LAIEYASEPVTVNAAQLASWHGSASREALSVDGPCPVCGHEAPNEIPRQFSALETTAPAPVSMLTVNVICTCHEDHPGRPEAVLTGCGRHWLVDAMIAPDGAVTLAPPPAPPDPTLEAAAQALREAGPRQLTDIRSAAEKWIGGVTALFSVFGLAGVITARSMVTNVPTGWQVGIAITAVISVALAGWAIYMIYRAAYGWPVTYAINNNDELLRWYDARQAAPRVQAGYLKDGVRAASAALAVLVVTVGLLWFAPPLTPVVPLVEVTLTNGSQVCGMLLPATPGATLIRRASDGTAIDIAPRSIVALTVAAAC